MRRLALAALALAATTLPAPAYYHFIHYLNGGNAPEKFDLSSLPNKTVTFFVSENGPKVYSATDTFNSVLSQIRQATLVWNGVASSDLRVAFGGLENGVTPQSTPGGDVVFEDLPAGTLGYGGPTSKANPVTASDGSTFVPIVRSTVHLNRNLVLAPGPSYNETFFMTTVHELGHSLGLQHTFTSSTMSQATTRATTLSHPIDNDDIAGVSVLYPNANFAKFGSITGKITTGGNGVHLASVVAIRVGAGAVSGVTNPDGTYRIDGVPPGQYFVYAHTMPPTADINGPWNADGSVAAPTGPVNALFYPGFPTLGQAASISVQQGQVTGAINIATAGRSSLPLYDEEIFSYLNGVTPVQPGVVNLAQGPATVAAYGPGLGLNGTVSGLRVQVAGGSVSIPNGPRAYQSNGATVYALDLSINLGAQPGSQHVVFNTPDYMYVLPSGFNLTLAPPPSITGVSPNGDGTLTVTGTNWAADTLLYFDGFPSTIVSLDAKSGTAVVTPPPGANGQQATLTAYNSDGQNSQFLQSASPVTFAYGTSPAPAITSVSPQSLPAGAEASIDITGAGFNFTQGLTTVGFGTTDIVVRRVFVLSPNHLQADVSIAPGAALSITDVNVISGFQLAIAPASFQIAPRAPGLPTPIPILENALPGLTGAYPGAIVSLYGSNLAPAAALAPVTGTAVTIGGQPVQVLYASPTQINLQLPATLTPGPATLTLNSAGAAAFPLTVNIDSLPAGVNAVQNGGGAYIDSTHPAHLGELLIVTLSNFAPAGTAIDPSRVQVSLGGVLHSVLPITQVNGIYQISFVTSPGDPTGQAEQLVVYLDGRSSYPATIPVARQNGTF